MFDDVPVALNVYSDWWLWWVPLVHVGGAPYTQYSMAIEIDLRKCAR